MSQPAAGLSQPPVITLISPLHFPQVVDYKGAWVRLAENGGFIYETDFDLFGE